MVQRWFVRLSGDPRSSHGNGTLRSGGRSCVRRRGTGPLCGLFLDFGVPFNHTVDIFFAHPDSYHTMMNRPGYLTPRNSQTVAFNHPPRPSQPTELVVDHQRMRTKRPLSTVDQEEDALIAYLNSKHNERHNREVRRSQ